MRNNLISSLAAFLLALSGTSIAEGTEPDSINWDYTFQLRAGVFFPDLDSSIRIDSSLGSIGDGLDFERDLGMSESKSTFYGGASWQFAPKHILEWEFFDLGRDGVVTAEGSWDIGDTTVLANGQIASTFNVRINRLTYRYRIFEDATKNLVLMAGVHATRAEASLALSGDLIVDGEPVFVLPDRPVTELEKSVFPLPHFGVGMNYALTPRLIGTAMVKAFAMEIGDTYGSLVEANLGVQYQVNEKFGIGGGFKWFFLDVVEDEGEFVDVKMEFDFFGPAIYVTYTF